MMEEISRNKALHLGPYVENSKYFPDRINMQLCHVVDRGKISRLKSMSGEPGTHMRPAREPARLEHLRRINSDWWETVCRFICRAESLLVEFAEDDRVFMTGPVVYIGSITLVGKIFLHKLGNFLVL